MAGRRAESNDTQVSGSLLCWALGSVMPPSIQNKRVKALTLTKSVWLEHLIPVPGVMVSGVISGKIILTTGFIQSTLWRGLAQCFTNDDNDKAKGHAIFYFTRVLCSWMAQDIQRQLDSALLSRLFLLILIFVFVFHPKREIWMTRSEFVPIWKEKQNSPPFHVLPATGVDVGSFCISDVSTSGETGEAIVHKSTLSQSCSISVSSEICADSVAGH